MEASYKMTPGDYEDYCRRSLSYKDWSVSVRYANLVCEQLKNYGITAEVVNTSKDVKSIGIRITDPFGNTWSQLNTGFQPDFQCMKERLDEIKDDIIKNIGLVKTQAVDNHKTLKVDTPAGTLIARVRTDENYLGIFVSLKRFGTDCELDLSNTEYQIENGQIISRSWGDANKPNPTHDEIHVNLYNYLQKDEVQNCGNQK